jgi:hypothetical protein
MMTDPRGLSRLPEEEEYWDALESRILAGLEDEVAAGGAPVLGPLAARAWALGFLAAAAGLVALLALPPRNASFATSLGLVRAPIGDPGYAEFVGSPVPPPLVILLGEGRESR